MKQLTSAPAHSPVQDHEHQVEIAYHKNINRWITMLSMPVFVAYTLFYGRRGDAFQAMLFALLSLNGGVALVMGLRIQAVRSLIRLKRISAGIAFGLLAVSFCVGMLSEQHVYLFIPWIFLFPLSVVLFFGRRIGMLCAFFFCLAMAVILLWWDLPPWSPSSQMFFRINAVFALFTLLAVALIAEKYRVRVQSELVALHDEYKKAEARQRAANVELQREIERRSQSERALAQSETRYRVLFEDSAVSMWEEDWSRSKIYLDTLPAEARADLAAYNCNHPETLKLAFEMTRVTAVNQATLRLFEADCLETLTKRLSVLSRGGGRFLAERLTALYANGRHGTELVGNTLKGRPLHMLVSSNIPAGYEASWKKVFTSVSDITERVAIEQEKIRVAQQLQHGRQIQAIATLAGGIAHQFNNALAVINGNLELLELKRMRSTGDRRHWDALHHSTKRMCRLTDQLLAYARGGKYRPKLFSANDLIRCIMDTGNIDPDPSTRIIIELAPKVPLALGDTIQITMVLEAVLANSLEAMESGGVLKIGTRNQRIGAGDAILSPGDYAVICIEDNGIGMAPEALERIFEPFYTTKIFGRGLGMAAAYGIVKNHDGMITVDSALSSGTQVTIFLPGAEAEAHPPPLYH